MTRHGTQTAHKSKATLEVDDSHLTQVWEAEPKGAWTFDGLVSKVKLVQKQKHDHDFILKSRSPGSSFPKKSLHSEPSQLPPSAQTGPA